MKKPTTKASAKTKAAAKPAPKAKAAAKPKPKVAQRDDLNAFATDFILDVPPEAAGGTYAPTMNDRWAGKPFKVPDGDHKAGSWTFTFAGGRFIHAAKK